MRRSLLAVLLAAAALLLSGCGGSSTSANQTAPVTTDPTQTVTGGSTTTTSAASPPTTTDAVTPTPATPSICRASDLTASFLGGQAATGHGLLGFALRNVSGHTCTSFGYPGVEFLSKSGQPLSTIPTHTTRDFFGSLPKAELTVVPGATISFRLGVTHGAAASSGCTTAYALQVIPPNDTSTLRIGMPNGAYECQVTTVSPVQTGTAAYP
jgi:hypothetical protein